MSALLILQSKKCLYFILPSLLILIFTFSSKAQFTTPRKTWDGPYDIKMIAAPNMEPVYVKPGSGSVLRADSLIRYSTMMMAETRLDINNRYSGGSPFQTIQGLRAPAILCQDLNTPCYAGIPVQGPDLPDCAQTYGTPDEIPDFLASMTYADYDNDNTTFSSSMAYLDISSCSEIEGAYLYWSGAFRGSDPAITLATPTPKYSTATTPSYTTANGNVFDPDATNFKTVQIKKPGGAYVPVTAGFVLGGTPGTRSTYICGADVTAILKGAGTGQFWVSNIRSYPNKPDGGTSSGWTLVVVFRNPLSSPRTIFLYDGFVGVNNSSNGGPTTASINLTGLQAPNSGNFNSYIGFAALDGENIGGLELDETEAREGLGFQTRKTTAPTATGTAIDINPNLEQLPNRVWANGLPALCDGEDNTDNNDCDAPMWDDANWCKTYDGVSSSKITSYSEVNKKNGNEILRLPALRNTLGFDAHHVKLPNTAGIIVPGANEATLTLRSGEQGGVTLFMAYIAIERLQPKLDLSKFASTPTTTPNSTYTYTLRVRNQGNTASLGARIYDTLDVATTYLGPVTSIRYVNGVASGSAGVTVVNNSGKLTFQIPPTPVLNAKDSVDITFTVKVEDFTNTNLWNVQCKRTIENTAWVRYKISSAAGNTDSLTAKSNGNDCGIGTETRILVTGLSGTPTVIGPFNACSYQTKTVLEAVKAILATQSGITPALAAEFDIRDKNDIRVSVTDSIKKMMAADLPIKAYRDIISGASCQQIYHINFSGCGLPVELISFEGWREGNANVLTWSTTSEKNNKQFVIERSFDGINFAYVGVTPGSGNSTIVHTYFFKDEPLNGISYYRLKQVDLNGEFHYSNVISITREAADIQIYPNPNNGSFTIRLVAPGEFYKLDITDLLGKTVYSASGNTVPESIEVNSLAKGVYLVRFYLENQVVIKKMMVY